MIFKSPSYSAVKIKKSNDCLIVSIPPVGWNWTTLGNLMFVIFLNAFSIKMILQYDKYFTFYIIFFVFVLILTGGVLFKTFGRVQLDINKSEVQFKRFFLSFGYKKIKQMKNLIKITEDIVYTRNYQPVYGIQLWFKNEGKLIFGASLKEEERKWLIEELHHLKNQYSEV